MQPHKEDNVNLKKKKDCAMDNICIVIIYSTNIY